MSRVIQHMLDGEKAAIQDIKDFGRPAAERIGDVLLSLYPNQPYVHGYMEVLCPG